MAEVSHNEALMLCAWLTLKKGTFSCTLSARQDSETQISYDYDLNGYQDCLVFTDFLCLRLFRFYFFYLRPTDFVWISCVPVLVPFSYFSSNFKTVFVLLVFVRATDKAGSLPVSFRAQNTQTSYHINLQMNTS